MEGTQPLEVLSGFGKTHVCGNEINNINSISNLLKNLWRNTSFFACHPATPGEPFCSDTENLFPLIHEILTRHLAHTKPALSRWPFKLSPAKDMEMQMKNALSGPASRIRDDPIPTSGNVTLPGHLGANHHQLP